MGSPATGSGTDERMRPQASRPGARSSEAPAEGGPEADRTQRDVGAGLGVDVVEPCQGGSGAVARERVAGHGEDRVVGHGGAVMEGATREGGAQGCASGAPDQAGGGPLRGPARTIPRGRSSVHDSHASSVDRLRWSSPPASMPVKGFVAAEPIPKARTCARRVRPPTGRGLPGEGAAAQRRSAAVGGGDEAVDGEREAPEVEPGDAERKEAPASWGKPGRAVPTGTVWRMRRPLRRRRAQRQRSGREGARPETRPRSVPRAVCHQPPPGGGAPPRMERRIRALWRSAAVVGGVPSRMSSSTL